MAEYKDKDEYLGFCGGMAAENGDFTAWWS